VTAARLTRAARPPDLRRGQRARRALAASFVAGAGILGCIGILDPGRFGQPRADTLRTGWPLLAVVGLVLAAAALGVSHRGLIGWLFARLREPFTRPLEQEPHFDEAVEALAACPAPLRLRYAVAWVWGPAAGALAGGTFAFSSAYFLVDAALAGFRIGWEQPLYAVTFALLGLAVFAAVAGRLASWRLATSVHKEVSTGYVH
jgi:hypothetical protein